MSRMEGLENSDKLCGGCRVASAHPTYNGYCEDCFVDKKLVKAYGSAPKDRSVRHSSHSVEGLNGINPDKGKESFT